MLLAVAEYEIDKKSLLEGVTTGSTAMFAPISFIQRLFCVCALSQNMTDLYEGIVFFTISYGDKA